MRDFSGGECQLTPRLDVTLEPVWSTPESILMLLLNTPKIDVGPLTIAHSAGGRASVGAHKVGKQELGSRLKPQMYFH